MIQGMVAGIEDFIQAIRGADARAHVVEHAGTVFSLTHHVAHGVKVFTCPDVKVV